MIDSRQRELFNAAAIALCTLFFLAVLPVIPEALIYGSSVGEGKGGGGPANLRDSPDDSGPSDRSDGSVSGKNERDKDERISPRERIDYERRKGEESYNLFVEALDFDGDGSVSFADAEYIIMYEPSGICYTGVDCRADVDGDGMVASRTDVKMHRGLATSLSSECSDGIDNDNDGYIDYGDDLQCFSVSDDES